MQIRRRDPRRHTRWRVGTLVAVHVVAAIHIAHWRLTGRSLAPLELNEVLHTLHAGILTAGFLFMALAVVVTAIFGRFFCSWGCHLLALQDASAWLLGKLRIRARPIRSRALVLLAPAAAFYLFVWPELERRLAGRAHPALAVHGASSAWASFVTHDFWRNLPGAGIAIATLFAAGFGIVYLLGSRSFCRYACPYGAIFAAADRVAPGRIVVRGDCSSCGACTAACQSHVRVHEELATTGMVVSSRCLKDLDCIDVCPTGALRYELVRPPLFRRLPALPAHRYDLSWSEETVVAGAALVAVLVLRGLYHAVPFLMALALAAIVAVLSLGALRLARGGAVRLGPLGLRRGGELTAVGGVVVATMALGGVLLAHSAFERAHEWLGDRALARAGVATAGGGGSTPGELDAAIAHLGWCERWGLHRWPALSDELADAHEARARLEARDGRRAAALADLHAAAALAPDRATVQLALGAIHARDGRLVLAERHLRRAVALAPDSSTAWDDLGVVLGQRGRNDEALVAHRAAVDANPRDAAAHANLGVLLANAGDLDEARTHLRRALVLDPSDGHAREALAVIGANDAFPR